MIISINSKRTPPPPHRGRFNHRLRHAGALLAVFAVSLLLIACPSPGGGDGTTTSDGGGNAIPDGGKPEPPAPDPEKPTPELPTPKPKAWHVITFAGSDSNGGTDGTGISASFTWPFSIAQSGATLYVTDRSWHSIRTIDTTTERVETIVTNGGNGLMGSYATGNGTTARFNNPSGIVAADAGTLYVADSNNHRIRKVTIGAAPAATQVDDFAGSGTAGHTNGAAAGAQFDNPTGLAIRGTTLYVADYNNHRIRTIDLASGTVRDIAGDGTRASRNGIGTAARFNKPTGIIAVSENTLYVATEGQRIRKLEYREAGS